MEHHILSPIHSEVHTDEPKPRAKQKAANLTWPHRHYAHADPFALHMCSEEIRGQMF